MSLFAELKRRNVFRVAIAYGVAAWLLLQVTDIVAPIMQLPDSVPRIVLFLLLIGLVPAVIFAWAFELTPEGVKRESEVDRSTSITARTGRKLDRTIIVVLAIAISFLLVDKFVLRDEKGSEPFSQETTSDSVEQVADKRALTPFQTQTAEALPLQRSVAVLPFVTMSSGPDDGYFSDGLTEEIINSLAQLPELLVTARTSAFHFKGQNLPVAEISSRLGVDHIVEGSVRRAGDQLRITAQLVRASDGFHLWSETYDRRTEDTLAVQEDIAEKIASALNVVLDSAQRARMQRAGVRNVEAFTAFQKGLELFEVAHGEGDLFGNLRAGNEYFEQAIALVPDFHAAYINHSDLFVHALLTHANGELDGDLSDQDVEMAPAALRADYEKAIQTATSPESRLATELDMALTLGEWRGLAHRTQQSLHVPGCTPPFWIQLASAAFGQAESLLESFSRFAACDPIGLRPWVHMAFARLWLGQMEQTAELTENRLKQRSHVMLTMAYVLAVAQLGRTAEAERAIDTQLREEDVQLITRAVLAAQTGDGDRAARLQEEYLGTYGPDDYHSLIMEAMRGRRGEANRLAGRIDGRPFGYMALMQAVYYCLCGAPFDLEATPVYAAMLAESGLPWPPPKPVKFPLKDW
jgi:TolB-like protein